MILGKHFFKSIDILSLNLGISSDLKRHEKLEFFLTYSPLCPGMEYLNIEHK